MTDDSVPAETLPDATPAEQAAAFLLEMRLERRVEIDLPDGLVPADFTSAYAIQDRVVSRLLDDGDESSGYKCACTSEIAQQALAIDRPVFGRLMPHTTSASGVTLPADGFTHRVIEAEIGFVMGSDVPARDGGHDRESIAEHISAALPSIEIVDYRYNDWTVGALQVAADNAIHGWWIEGTEVADWRDLDLADVAVEVRRNGEIATTGSGANVLGHPLEVMAWLANELPMYGRALRTGDRITTGVTTDVFEAEAGDSISASFAGLGDVSVDFV